MLKLTEFDELVGSPGLQMLKALLPYLDPHTQTWLAVYIQTQILQNTLAIFQTPDQTLPWTPHEIPSTGQLLDYLRPYGGPAEQSTLDDIRQAMEAMKLYQKYSDLQKHAKGPLSPMDLMKEMLPPDQAAMFQTYSSLFQNLGGT